MTDIIQVCTTVFVLVKVFPLNFDIFAISVMTIVYLKTEWDFELMFNHTSLLRVD